MQSERLEIRAVSGMDSILASAKVRAEDANKMATYLITQQRRGAQGRGRGRGRGNRTGEDKEDGQDKQGAGRGNENSKPSGRGRD